MSQTSIFETCEGPNWIVWAKFHRKSCHLARILPWANRNRLRRQPSRSKSRCSHPFVAGKPWRIKHKYSLSWHSNYSTHTGEHVLVKRGYGKKYKNTHHVLEQRSSVRVKHVWHTQKAIELHLITYQLNSKVRSVVLAFTWSPHQPTNCSCFSC